MTDKTTEKQRKSRKGRLFVVTGVCAAFVLVLAVVLKLLLDFRYTGLLTCAGAADMAAATEIPLGEVFAGDFAANETESREKYIQYLEDRLKEELLSFDSVTDADLQLNIPEENDSLAAVGREAGVLVRLEHNGGFTEKDAESLAGIIAAVLNSENMSGIIIEDNSGNLLFSGGEKSGTAVRVVLPQNDA